MPNPERLAKDLGTQLEVGDILVSLSGVFGISGHLRYDEIAGLGEYVKPGKLDRLFGEKKVRAIQTKRIYPVGKSVTVKEENTSGIWTTDNYFDLIKKVDRTP